MNKPRLDLLLINPPQTFYGASRDFCKYFPTGLAYLAASVEKTGFSVQVLDALVEGFEIHHRGDSIQYGMSWGALRKVVAGRKANVIGVTAPFTAQVGNAFQVAGMAKEAQPQSLVVFGGPHASVQPREVLEQCSAVDIAVLGEGEHILPEIMRLYDGKRVHNMESIEGIAYRSDGEVSINPSQAYAGDLDALPLPAYHLFDMEAYLNSDDPYLYSSREGRSKREMPIITSRGCPYDCVFCSVHLHMGRKFRAHSASYVVDHIAHLVERYSVQHLHFEDDNFTLNRRRANDILDHILARGLKFTWDTPNGIRADLLTPEMLQKMKASGCLGLNIGVESGDQEVLDGIVRKKLSLDKVVEAARLCQEVGLRLGAFFVLGFPGETVQNMRRTIGFAEMLASKYDVANHFMVATPLYGSRLYELASEKGYLTEPLSPQALSQATQVGGKPLIATEDFTGEDIAQVFSEYEARLRDVWRQRYREAIERRFSMLGPIRGALARLWVSPLGARVRSAARAAMRRS